MKNFKMIISILFILVPAFYFGLIGKPAEMGVALAAGALAAAFINLEKLEKFKGAGIEFELKKAVEEAYATIEVVKAVAEPLFISAIKTMSEGRTLGGISKRDQHDLVNKMEKVTTESLNSNDVKNAIDSFYKFNLRAIFRDLQEDVYKYRNVEVETTLSRLIDRENSVYPSGQQIRDILSPLTNLQDETDELIKDYEYYRTNKVPRNM